jgi:hypothetical protein
MTSFLKKYKSDLLIVFIFIFTAAITFTYTGCNDDINAPDDPSNTKNFPVFKGAEAFTSPDAPIDWINDAIEDIALVVARSMQDKACREFYKCEAMKKFDGDFDILYSLVKNKPVGHGMSAGKTLYTRLSEITEDIKKSSELKFKTQFKTFDELISTFDRLTTFPILNIAIYVKCAEWDTDNHHPFVACAHHELTPLPYLVSYDSDGKTLQLDIQNIPDNTLLAITACERLDENGNVREVYLGGSKPGYNCGNCNNHGGN